MLRLTLLLLTLLIAGQSQARQSCDWPFRTTIIVNETSGLTTNNYSVKLTLTGNSGGTLHPAYNWSSTGNDLRIFSSDDLNPLNFSIESWNPITKTAEVWVTFPTFTNGSINTIYVYYGNTSAISAGGTPPTISYVDDKIKFHTRYNDDTVNDPTSLSHIKALFDAQNDNNPAYGCSHPDTFSDITNRSEQGGSGSQQDFIAFSEAYFTVPTNGQWGVRYGADYGLGGGLYVDGVAWDERWDDDLWWRRDWDHEDVLSDIRFLSAGEHKLEIIGAEGGNDGGLSIQFSLNGANWITYDNNIVNNLDITLRSQACSVIRHTILYGNHDVCEVDLSITSSTVSNEWFVGSENNLSFQVNYQDSTPSGLIALADTYVTIQLPAQVSLTGSFYSGLNWSCTGTTGIISCNYTQPLTAASSSSSTLILYTTVAGSADDNFAITSQVSGSLLDTQTANNSDTQNITLLSNAGLPAGCSSPKPGIWARFFDTASAGIVIDDAVEYQTLINNQMLPSFMYGQTILSNINSSGNPFDNSANPNHFVVIFQGYINITNSGNYYFGVDGDDAVEAWLDDSIISAYYGAHGTSGGSYNKTRRNLGNGFHKIEFRLQENEGGDAYDFYWSRFNGGGDTIIPASAFYHCAGNPDIQLNTTVTVISDDINGLLNPKAIPGAVLNMLVNVTNNGNISTDLNSTVIVQAIDAETKFYIGNFNGAGPIDFNDGSNASGLIYNYSGLNDNTDSLSFSVDGSNFNHTAVDDGEGYDPAITHIKLEFDGTMKPTMNAITPSFSFGYQVKVK